MPTDERWFLSCPHIEDLPVGLRYDEFKSQNKSSEAFTLPIRFVGFTKTFDPSIETSELKRADENHEVTDLFELGILEQDSLSNDQQYPIISGSGFIQAMAITKMVALNQNVPFKKDFVLKVSEDQNRRSPKLTIELLGGLCELLSMASQLAKTETSNLRVLKLRQF